jgi:flagellar capping protein FliD
MFAVKKVMKRFSIILANVAIANFALAQANPPAPAPKPGKDQTDVGVKVGLSAPVAGPLGFSGLPYNPTVTDSLQYLYMRKLQKKEDEINADYDKRIKSVQNDVRLTHKQKRQTVRSLKHQRDKDLDQMISKFNKQLAYQQHAPVVTDLLYRVPE